MTRDVKGYAISLQLMRQTSIIAVILCGMLLLTACENEGDYPREEAQQETRTDTQRTTQTNDDRTRIIVLGNSIAAGYGVGQDAAFPAILQDFIDDHGWDASVVNAGVSGETTAGGLRRLNWILDQQLDILIIELGGNDGLRGTPVEHTRENLQEMIDRTRDTHPDAHIILAGMQLPPSMGESFTQEFRQIYPELAQENNVELVPFVLEGVGGNPDLNQSDGIHPTAEGQRIVAQNVWAVLEPVIESMQHREEPVIAE